MNTKLLTRTALFAALTAVCSWLSIPMPWGVPINLATLAVFLAGAVLGAKWGTVSILVYVALGLVGIPVFSGFRGGLSVLAGPTGGYIIGYIGAALVVGLLTHRFHRKWVVPASMAAALAVCYAFGTAWFMVVTGNGLMASLSMCVLPYLVGDAIKIAIASVLLSRLR